MDTELPDPDRVMWIAIRSSLLGIAKAIDTNAKSSALAVAIRAGLLGITAAIEKRYELKKNR